jgi:tRNA(adenine34) deaminase
MKVDSQDKVFMRRAINLAKQGSRKPDGSPIGCVIVLDGQVIGEGHNEVEAFCDPTAHAEIVSMRRAGNLLHQSQFKGAVLYSTLQPCGMCTMASIWGGISRIVYGAERHQVHPMYFECRHFNTIDFILDAFRSDLQVEGGLCDLECAALYYGPSDEPSREEQANR